MQPFLIEFLLIAFAIIMLVIEAFLIPEGKKAILAPVGIIFLLITFILLNFFTASTADINLSWVERFYTHSPRATLFKNIALLATTLTLVMSWDFRKNLSRLTTENNSDAVSGEFYILPIFACAGMMWMASAADFVSIFVSLELVTICFYIMVAYLKRNVGSLEAGVKYLILGALSTGILVYGIAWTYGSFGTTQLDKIASLAQYTQELSLPTLFGLSMLLIAIAFKVGAVPMQLWIPDVYQGAPTPITAYLSTASKASGFAIAITIFQPFLKFEKFQLVFMILAAGSLIYSALAALTQSNLKRLLAYSSISHAGFILIAFSQDNMQLVCFYLVSYLIMTYAAFLILNAIDGDEIKDFNGLAKHHSLIALCLTVIMLTMAGLPLTLGFVSKFLVIKEVFNSPHALPYLIIIFLSVACGFYYYLKVIKAMYLGKATTPITIKISSLSLVIVLLLTGMLIYFGIIPKALHELTQF